MRHNRLSAPVPIWTSAWSSGAESCRTCTVTIAYRIRSRYGPVTNWNPPFCRGGSHNRLSAPVPIWTGNPPPQGPAAGPVTIAYRLRCRYGHGGPARKNWVDVYWTVTIAYRLRSRYGPGLTARMKSSWRSPRHNRLSAPVPIWTWLCRGLYRTPASRVTIAYRLRCRYGPGATCPRPCRI